jgi:anti-anti-sigma regulatory factor
MTLKITPTGPGPPTVLTLDGRLTGDEVAELRRVFDEVGGKVILDLTGLQFADRPGVSALRELKAHGAKLTGVSPYIALLLGEARHDAAN